MKRLAVLAVLVLAFEWMAQAGVAQRSGADDKNSGDFGVYFDYFRLNFAKLNLFGVGGRVGFTVHPAVAIEGEMSYDFERSTTDTITSGGVTNTFRSNPRLIPGPFGPKIPTTKDPVRVFVVLKAWCLTFCLSRPSTRRSLPHPTP